LPSDYKDDGTNILLDANENAYGPSFDIEKDESLRSKNSMTNGHEASGEPELDFLGLNRYPDPYVSILLQSRDLTSR
jgi:histidinol-phosphate aminotransferase